MISEERREYNREYRIKNRDRFNVRARKYYQKHKKKHIACVMSWKERNPEKIKEYNRRHRQTHKEQKKEYDRKYNQQNKERVRERRRKYRLQNKEKLNECSRRHYQKNKERINEYHRQYYNKNREKIKAQRRKKITEKKRIQNPGNPGTKNQLLTTLKKFTGMFSR